MWKTLQINKASHYTKCLSLYRSHRFVFFPFAGPLLLIENQLYLQGGAGTVSMDQAVVEVILLEAVEASANASSSSASIGSVS